MGIVALAGGVVALLTVADLFAAIAEMVGCIVRPEGDRELLIFAIVAGLT